jgi:magnesium transporter
VLRQYEYISEAYEWFNWFLPLIIASGGNAGSQSATLIIRAMAIEEMDRHDIIKMIKRELVVAMMLALGLMTLGYLIATVFFSREQAEVVATTIFLVVLMGTTIGALIPLLFRKLGMDPALMSNPLLAAIVDVFGAVIYCTVVIILLMS